MKKHIHFFGILPVLLLSLSSCNLVDFGGITEQSVIDQIYSEYKNNGGTLEYSDWLLSIKGKKGDPGEPGQKGENGVDGKDGVDGQTPYIGNNGNWWIGDTDTGVSAYLSSQTDSDNLEEFQFYLLNDGTYGIGAGGAKYLDEIVIPDTYKGRPVTKIVDEGFYGANIKSIKLGNNIKYLGNYSFFDCSYIEEIDLKNVEEIGYGTFIWCLKLDHVFLSKKIQKIDVYAFHNLSNYSNLYLEIENDEGSNLSNWKAIEYGDGGGPSGYGVESSVTVLSTPIEHSFSQNTNALNDYNDFDNYTWVRQ